MATSALPPDLFDQTTIVSLLSTVAILTVAVTLSRAVLDPATTPGRLRFLFVWHAFDALVHFCLEGGFLYHCFFSSVPNTNFGSKGEYYPDAENYLGTSGVVHGVQAAEGAVAGLWMVYARADRRWAGADLGVVSLELLTVFVVGPLAVFACYDIAKKSPRANIVMIILATAELYGGFMTFCPEWLVNNINLDGSNFMYMWVYLVFFNMLWVFIPFYSIYVSSADIFDAFKVRAAALEVKKVE
ncbi:Emopamil-binding protein [Lasiosphaeria hispida]|uniref:Emopamil-binding protein n=1 Tax=Lasiosphaeria hispida TaxID=260671 RepID=A0AAJ0HR92_9PEZI|nr:Emopamil-binding protein [Lasiosphaeria hispida]